MVSTHFQKLESQGRLVSVSDRELASLFEVVLVALDFYSVPDPIQGLGELLRVCRSRKICSLAWSSGLRQGRSTHIVQCLGWNYFYSITGFGDESTDLTVLPSN